MADKLANFAYSTVATAPSPASSGTSLVVQSGDGALFPAVPFSVVVWPANQKPLSTNAEILRVTSVSTDTFTIVRQSEGTSARSIQVGDQIAQNITERMIEDRPPIVNVKNYGAVGDDTTDDFQAIQDAIDNSDEGDIIYFPKGIYRVSEAITLKRNRVYQGVHAPRWYYRGGVVCAIKPHSTFADTRIVYIPDKEITSESDDNDGGRIYNLAIDGNSHSSSVIGLQMHGLCRDWYFRDMDISQTSGNAFSASGYTRVDTSTYYPRGYVMENVTTYSAGNNGFVLNSATDCSFINCLAVDVASIGFLIDSPGETKFVSCRSVFNDSDGFRVTGSVTVGGVQFIGCSTDRNVKYGLKVTATGTQPVEIVGFLARRDGSSDTGNLAGIGLVGTVGNEVCPVNIVGLDTTIGYDDGGGGTQTPDYGIYMEYTQQVSASGTAWGTIDGVGDGGNNAKYDFVHLHQKEGTSGTEDTTRVRGTIEVTGVDVLGSNADIANISYDAGNTQLEIVGSDASAGKLLLQSTAHATKGKIILGAADGTGAIFEENTGRFVIGDTAADAPLHVESADDEVLLKLKSTHSGATNSPLLQMEGENTADRLFQGGLTADTTKRINILAGGTVEWGDGSATRDTNLYRNAADVLKTDDSFIVGADLQINETAYYDGEVDNGNSGTSDTIDWGVGNVQKTTLNGDCTYIFTAPAGPCHLTLKIVHSGSSRNPSWPATVKWANGVEPTWSTTDTSVDIATFYYDGTNYYGMGNKGFA